MSTAGQVLGEAGKRLRDLPKLPVKTRGWRALKWIANFLFVIGVVLYFFITPEEKPPVRMHGWSAFNWIAILLALLALLALFFVVLYFFIKPEERPPEEKPPVRMHGWSAFNWIAILLALFFVVLYFFIIPEEKPSVIPEEKPSVPVIECEITTASPLPQGTVGQDYSATLAAKCDPTPLKWSAPPGDLPPGLSLDEDGKISVKPEAATVVRTFSFEVTVTNSATPPQSATNRFEIMIGPPHALITVNIQALRFDPPTLILSVSDTVTWVHNQGQVPHSVTSGNLGAANAGSVFDSRANPNTCTEDGDQSGCMRSPAMFSHTFANPGTFPYHCVVHGALMTGTITVNGADGVPAKPKPSVETSKENAKPKSWGGIAKENPAWFFGGFCVVIAVFVLSISFPIYLFSANVERSNKAGVVVKMTLRFIFGTGGLVLGTLSFAPAR